MPVIGLQSEEKEGDLATGSDETHSVTPKAAETPAF